MPIAGAKYVHTNLISRDWQALVRFYEDVFGCTSIPPERHFSGPDLEAGTGVRGAELQGAQGQSEGSRTPEDRSREPQLAHDT